MTRRGVLLYEISLKVVGSKYAVPILYTTQQRYSRFKQLCKDLCRLDQEQMRRHRERSKTAFVPSSEPAEKEKDWEVGGARSSSASGFAAYESFMDAISAPFPQGIKALLGMALTDSDLSER